MRKTIAVIGTVVIFILFSTVARNALAIGTFTVELTEHEKICYLNTNNSNEVILYGFVNFTGGGATETVVSLTSNCDLWDSIVEPNEVRFRTSGSEEFNVKIDIPQNTNNGTTGHLSVTGISQQGATTYSYADFAEIYVFNLSEDGNGNNQDKSEKDKPEDNQTFPLIILIVVVAIIALFLIYKLKFKKE
ncbi:MAG: hypothetical protein JSW00_03590 [Thermoplasmata archaeon]|nr:MAG: hypothetical protein JSW00_03590 [Thermoplasmata archaeon]